MSQTFPSDLCKNCGVSIDTPFCSQCGQTVKVEVPTIKTFIHDSFVAVISYDAKVWRTLRKLVTEPGQLTVDYVEGRRISLVTPVSLYFWLQTFSFLSFQFFARHLATQADSRARSILVMTGVLAVIVAIFNWKQKRKFAEHLVFSLHLNSFLLLIMMFAHGLIPQSVVLLKKLGWVQQRFNPDPLFSYFLVAFLVPYTVLALRRFYGDSYLVAILKTVAFYYSYFFIYIFVMRWFKLA